VLHYRYNHPAVRLHLLPDQFHDEENGCAQVQHESLFCVIAGILVLLALANRREYFPLGAV
jgi:hypothetical protein